MDYIQNAFEGLHNLMDPYYLLEIAYRASSYPEFFTCIPLRKLVVTSMPLKSLVTPLYPRANFLLAMCPSVHIVLEGNS